MSVTTSESRIGYTGDGVTVNFTFPYLFQNNADIEVWINDVQVTSGFTTTGASNAALPTVGGNVAFVTAPAIASTVELIRNPTTLQNTVIAPNDPFPAKTVETMVDAAMLAIQRLNDILALQPDQNQLPVALSYPFQESTLSGTLPPAVTRALSVLGFDVNGLPIALPLPAAIGAGDMRTEEWTDGVDYTSGTSTSVTLSRSYGNKANLGSVVMQGVAQDPASYALSGTALTFNAVIPFGTGKIWCTGGTTLSLNEPAQGSVTDDSLAPESNIFSRAFDWISVTDKGAVGNGVADDYPAFQAAINALPTFGGRIVVPAKAFLLSVAPTWGTKSIFWDISPGATFTGAGSGGNAFPSMNTNIGQLAVGPWIQSQSSVPSPTIGGIAAFNIEMLQPATYVGQSVALYTGANGSSPDANSNVWSINCLIDARPGAGGIYQCIEADANCYSSTATVIGIDITGVGSSNPLDGLRVGRGDTTAWDNAIHVFSSIRGVVLEGPFSGFGPHLVQGISVNTPTNSAGSWVFGGRQITNGQDFLLGQRVTDTSPSGNFIRFTDTANTTNLFQLDVLGNVTTGGFIQGGILSATKPASAGTGTQLTLGAGTSATATTGGAVLPASPVGFLTFFLGATPYKLPYYNL